MEQVGKPVRYRRRLVLFSLVTVMIMCAIFILSSQPADDSSELSGRFLSSPLGQFIIRIFPALTDQGEQHDIRKYAHMWEFMCLGGSTYLTVREMLRPYYKHPAFSLFWAWLICLFYACTDEFHQLFVEGRSCQVTDVCIDAAGFTLGIVFICAAIAVIIKKREGER